MGYKTRSNYALSLKITDEEYDRIFKKKKKRIGEKVFEKVKDKFFVNLSLLEVWKNVRED